jgi:hypothetical protein
VLDESQVKTQQQRQKIKMFFGPPMQVVETVNQWVEQNAVHIVEQQMQVLEPHIIVSVLYMSNMKPTASTRTLPPAKGQQPLLNIGVVKAAYEQS